jgi:hypothetical protein
MSSSPGGSAIPGADAYATSKQCNLATVTLQRARTGLYSEHRPGGEANVFLPFLLYYILPLLAPLDHGLINFTGDRSNDFRVLEVQPGLLERSALLLHIGDGRTHASLG